MKSAILIILALTLISACGSPEETAPEQARATDSAPAPVDCIRDVADALRDRLEIICDGGIRRGSHVVKALALGANACSIGRGYVYAFAAGGQPGVERALTLLRAEVERTMALIGCSDVDDLDRRFVIHRPTTT